MSAVERVRAAYARMSEVDRPEVWITLRDEAELLAEAKDVDRRVDGGERLPLAGLLVAVKDNIDVAGLPTTAGCPSYAYQPELTAPAVARLVDAGALVLGKTNLDQFATGLVGTRSPYGAVRGALLPDRVSGGSSSGSAVAVALGIADIGIGTDTAGSGRVPAAFNGIVGIKPTLGLVPTTGVVPACRSYDAVTAFAATLALAQRAIAVMTGLSDDPRGRTWPPDVRLSAGDAPVVAVPDAAGLAQLSPAARAAFTDAAQRLGVPLREIDISPLLAAAALLYDGALVAERYAAVGAFIDGAPDVDPSVRAIIGAARDIPAHAHVADLARLDAVKAAGVLHGCAALLLPTAPRHPTLAEVAADPIGVNRGLGAYTNFVNLMDLCAVAVPGGSADGGPFGVSVIARAFDDQVAIDIAARLTGEQAADPYPGTGVDLVVFGAHLRGQPLNHQLTAVGARYSGAVRTAPEYRMVLITDHRPSPASSTPDRWTASRCPASAGGCPPRPSARSSPHCPSR